MLNKKGSKLYATDDRYCIDNGAMIAQAGLLQFLSQKHLSVDNNDKDFNEVNITPFGPTAITQRFRTDQVLVTWRD